MNHWIRENNPSERELHTVFTQAKPFPHLILPDFFDEQKILSVLRSLLKEKWYPKQADLFSFKQTNDLVSSQQKALQDFRSFLCSPDFLQFMKEITGCTLRKIDLAGTLYEPGDYLLCHDDQLDKRKIAFFVYLSTPEEGGELALFSSRNGIPIEIGKHIKPAFNTFAFFEVSPLSFHQVEEVLKGQRIAISGWFS